MTALVLLFFWQLLWRCNTMFSIFSMFCTKKKLYAKIERKFKKCQDANYNIEKLNPYEVSIAEMHFIYNKTQECANHNMVTRARNVWTYSRHVTRNPCWAITDMLNIHCFGERCCFTLIFSFYIIVGAKHLACSLPKKKNRFTHIVQGGRIRVRPWYHWGAHDKRIESSVWQNPTRTVGW